MNPLKLTPVGVVRSEHELAVNTPIQPVFAHDCTGTVEVFSEYEDGLKDIEGFSHLILIYWLHEAEPPRMLVTPFLDDAPHGIFATRFPYRPNPIGLSVVRLVKREGGILTIAGVDILDGTPVLDIKPYSSRFDCYPDARNGWMDSVSLQEAAKRGRRGYCVEKGKENIS